MKISTEAAHSLRVLGLPPDATASDVRSAFRRLARTYHPDVAGRQYSRKYEQIAEAYALLKDLPQAEFSHAANTARPPKSGPQNNPGRRFSFRGVLGRPIVWYKKRRERVKAEKEQLRREAAEAQKKILLKRKARIEAILKRGEQSVGDFLSRRESETQDIGIQGLAMRLMSDMRQVRHMAMAHLGELANSPEIFEALFHSLQKWDIDEHTARLASALPLNSENHRRLARGLSARAAAMPDALLSHLLRLHNPRAADREILESYLRHAEASGVALILRRWPRGEFISEPTICRLLSHKDESVLVTVLSAMKQRSIPCPKDGLERMNSHLSHPNTAVRVWAKALLPAVKN